MLYWLQIKRDFIKVQNMTWIEALSFARFVFHNESGFWTLAGLRRIRLGEKSATNQICWFCNANFWPETSMLKSG